MSSASDSGIVYSNSLLVARACTRLSLGMLSVTIRSSPYPFQPHDSREPSARYAKANTFGSTHQKYDTRLVIHSIEGERAAVRDGIKVRLSYPEGLFTLLSHSHIVKLWGGLMWVPTQDEAVLIYARFLRARHGAAASKLARKKAGVLQDQGDLEGYKIWNAVADAVDRPSDWPQPRLLVRGRAA